MISFESGTRSHSVTNGYYLKRFSGSITISKADYGIVETSLNYQLDTATLNRFTRSYNIKNGKDATIFLNILDHDEVNVNTSYSKRDDGFYYPALTTIIRNQKGVDIEHSKPVLLQAETKIHFLGIEQNEVDVGRYHKVINFNQIKYNSAFWKEFRRPG